MNTVICKTCGEEIELDGDYPDLSAYCETCDEELVDADVLADYIADLTDYHYDMARDAEYDRATDAEH